MKLILIDHLKSRLKLRGVSEKTVKNIFNKSQGFYWDSLRNHYIAVSQIKYKGKTRKMLVAYDKILDAVELITVHPVTDEEIDRRIKSGRWVYEKKHN